MASSRVIPDQSQLLLRLCESDHVAVAVTALPAGTSALGVRLQQDVPTGHKVALCCIAMGKKVLKCGTSIGSTTRDVAPGEHVHTHNLKSDYLPTFTMEQGHLFIEKHT